MALGGYFLNVMISYLGQYGIFNDSNILANMVHTFKSANSTLDIIGVDRNADKKRKCCQDFKNEIRMLNQDLKTKIGMRMNSTQYFIKTDISILDTDFSNITYLNINFKFINCSI